MTRFGVRNTIVPACTLGLVFSAPVFIGAASPSASGHAQQSALPTSNVVIKPGGVRGDQGQTLRVIVKLKGQTLKNVAATIKITGSDQQGTVTGTTSMKGVYSVALNPGTYTVTATTAHYTASGNITIVASTNPAILTLNLAPKS
jgi:hypothetical protein